MSYTYIDDYLDDAAPIAVAKSPGRITYRDRGKRLLDILLVVTMSPVIIPVVFAAWLAMFLSGGAGFFRQPRVGRYGRIFTCWKIRTMGNRAEAELIASLKENPTMAAEWGRSQKLQNDPRITRLGRFLRRTSIDELPQFWNVLKGDMSLIGPRPFTPDQKHLYDVDPQSVAYYRLRPGISGLWQVKSRNRGQFQDRIGFDATYENDVSFGKDLEIVGLTIREVLQATGK